MTEACALRPESRMPNIILRMARARNPGGEDFTAWKVFYPNCVFVNNSKVSLYMTFGKRPNAVAHSRSRFTPRQFILQC